MANINDAFPSKYIKASDLQGTEPVVTIKRVAFEDVGKDKERKPIVYFKGKDKGLVLNKTNANKIVQLSGRGDTDDWKGLQIKLYATETQFAGETVDCVRIKGVTNGKSMAAKALPVAQPDEDEDDSDEEVNSGHSEPLTDDDIPF